ncbi:MAG TPA: hypothetical protein VGM88_20130 [Kofleriaceae bacterium]|jgi:hypothetical protein
MNTKSIIASLALVLGIGSSAAMAAPVHHEVDLTQRDKVTVIDRTFHRAPERTIVVHEGHREPQRPIVVRPIIVQSYWVQLAQGITYNWDGRTSVNLARPMSAREITLAANGCAMPVTEVSIQYTDGTGQVERNLNQLVDAQHPLTLGTNPYKTISRVIVYGQQGQQPRLDGSLTLSALT